ncbi:MAG: c-type cytochrome [Bacteroidota bacterium]|nr:c-type cytochrome [Bacteroidota bacterium]
MKKLIVILSSVLFFISCGNNTDTKEKSADTTATTTPAAETKDPEITKGLDLVAKSDCFTCHKLTEPAIGPSYALVAEKYNKIDRQAAIDSISHQIINGGSGKWGSVPMTPHPALTKDDTKAMAIYILSIKNN